MADDSLSADDIARLVALKDRRAELPEWVRARLDQLVGQSGDAEDFVRRLTAAIQAEPELARALMRARGVLDEKRRRGEE